MLSALTAPFVRYARWLHTRWPSGTVESLPEIRADGGTAVPGLYIVGDLTGIPLLKFALDTGARAVRTILAGPGFARELAEKAEGVCDLGIVGAGGAGMAAAVEAGRAGLDLIVFEAKRRFQTVADFPNGKPIYTYPRDMTPAGELQVKADLKEDLYDELLAQTGAVKVSEGSVASVGRAGGLLEVRLADGAVGRALRVVVAIGRSGNYLELGGSREDLDKVHNRLDDPEDFQSPRALVVRR